MAEDSIETRGGPAEDDETGADTDMERFRGFTAIQDVPPQKTLFLTVEGEVLVSNPGVDVELVTAEPQGVNPNILLLTVLLHQRPGIWPRVMTWKRAHYRSGMVSDGQYGTVQLAAPFGSHSVKVVKRA